MTEKLLANHKALRYKKVSQQRDVETVRGSYIILLILVISYVSTFQGHLVYVTFNKGTR